MYFYIRAVVRNSAVTAVYKIIFRGIFRFSSLENVSYEEKIRNGLGSVWRALPKVKRQVRRSQKTTVRFIYFGGVPDARFPGLQETPLCNNVCILWKLPLVYIVYISYINYEFPRNTNEKFVYQRACNIKTLYTFFFARN